VTYPFPSKDPEPGASTGQQGKEWGGDALGERFGLETSLGEF